MRLDGGTIKGENRKGITFYNDTIGAAKALHQVLDGYSFEVIESSYAARTKTEQQLDQEEMRSEGISGGANVIHQGSIATLYLKDYTPEKAKALVLALQGLPFVNVAQIDPNTEVKH